MHLRLALTSPYFILLIPDQVDVKQISLFCKGRDNQVPGVVETSVFHNTIFPEIFPFNFVHPECVF